MQLTATSCRKKSLEDLTAQKLTLVSGIKIPMKHTEAYASQELIIGKFFTLSQLCDADQIGAYEMLYNYR